VRRYDREQHRVRRARRLLARGDRACGRGRARIRVRGRAARRARYRGRRARRAPVGRPAPANRDRAGASEKRAGADPRRSDVRARYGVRAACAERAQPVDGRQDDARDRASAVDDRARGPDRRDVRGPDRRDRHACDATREGRALRRALPDAVRGLTAPRPLRAEEELNAWHRRAARAALHVWYGDSAWRWPLWPLAALFRGLVEARAAAYRAGVKRSVRLPVPVVVVGNVTVGGTGKTPFVIWLARELAARGHSPGIVTRGYRGNAVRTPHRVTPVSSADDAGDEPMLLAVRTARPVVAAADRVAAAEALLAEAPDVDVLLSDDG